MGKGFAEEFAAGPEKKRGTQNVPLSKMKLTAKNQTSFAIRTLISAVTSRNTLTVT